ncbi:hypothetical protein TGVAND_435840 [Toxoplasma gondii VAND]|uniref:Uncharacterized protein n=1 Tax=Toxoplasma gondii VAND TaxID=933077 RepID=A0A086QE15_TOXGO|nr:hypothetical protein TGVAND_435840 [Toxoplasma gondii VAND]
MKATRMATQAFPRQHTLCLLHRGRVSQDRPSTRPKGIRRLNRILPPPRPLLLLHAHTLRPLVVPLLPPLVPLRAPLPLVPRLVPLLPILLARPWLLLAFFATL